MSRNSSYSSLIVLCLVIVLFLVGAGIYKRTTDLEQQTTGASTPSRDVALGIPDTSSTSDVPPPVPTSITPGVGQPTPVTLVPTFIGETPKPYVPPPSPTTGSATITPIPPGWNDPDFSNPPTPSVYPKLPPTPQPSDPINAVLNAERVPAINYSSKKAELIVVGKVTKVGPSRWSTPDGKRPPNPWAKDNQDYIYTPITVTVSSNIMGTAPKTELLIKGYGGVVGKDSLRWGSDDLYDFIEGDQVILFLFRTQGVDVLKDRTHLDIWEVADRFSITKDGQAVNTYHKMPVPQLLDAINQALVHP